MIWQYRWGNGEWARVNFLSADKEEATLQIMSVNPERARRVHEGKLTFEIRRNEWQLPIRSKKHLSTDYAVLPVRFTRAQVDEVKERAAKRHLTVSEYVRTMLLSE